MTAWDIVRGFCWIGLANKIVVSQDMRETGMMLGWLDNSTVKTSLLLIKQNKLDSIAVPTDLHVYFLYMAKLEKLCVSRTYFLLSYAKTQTAGHNTRNIVEIAMTPHIIPQYLTSSHKASHRPCPTDF